MLELVIRVDSSFVALVVGAKDCAGVPVLAVVGRRENRDAGRVVLLASPHMELEAVIFLLMRSHHGSESIRFQE